MINLEIESIDNRMKKEKREIHMLTQPQESRREEKIVEVISTRRKTTERCDLSPRKLKR